MFSKELHYLIICIHETLARKHSFLNQSHVPKVTKFRNLRYLRRMNNIIFAEAYEYSCSSIRIDKEYLEILKKERNYIYDSHQLTRAMSALKSNLVGVKPELINDFGIKMEPFRDFFKIVAEGKITSIIDKWIEL